MKPMKPRKSDENLFLRYKFMLDGVDTKHRCQVITAGVSVNRHVTEEVLSRIRMHSLKRQREIEGKLKATEYHNSEPWRTTHTRSRRKVHFLTPEKAA